MVVVRFYVPIPQDSLVATMSCRSAEAVCFQGVSQSDQRVGHEVEAVSPETGNKENFLFAYYCLGGGYLHDDQWGRWWTRRNGQS